MVCRDEEGGGRGGYTDAPILVKKDYFVTFRTSTLRLKKLSNFIVLKIKETPLKSISLDTIWNDKYCSGCSRVMVLMCYYFFISLLENSNYSKSFLEV